MPTISSGIIDQIPRDIVYCRLHSHLGVKTLVEQTYNGLLGLPSAASYQPTGVTQRTALNAVLADLRFLITSLMPEPSLGLIPAAVAAPGKTASAGDSFELPLQYTDVRHSVDEETETLGKGESGALRRGTCQILSILA